MEQTAIVTGAGGALGTAVARELIRHDWTVVGVERQPMDAEHVTPVVADLTTVEGAQDAVAAAGPRLRGVAHCIGGFDMSGNVGETDIARFERQFTINLRTAYLIAQAALPTLIATKGAMVFVSTRAAVRPFAGAAGYIASKAALLALVDVLDAEYRDQGVRTNAVMPSVIDTPANREAMPNADTEKWVTPEEIATVIRHLLSDDAVATSGAHVPVYGRA